MPRIIITGGAGLLGLNWALHTQENYVVHLWLNNRRVDIDDISTHHVDLTVPSAIAKALDAIKPDIVINTAGFTSVEGCEFNPAKSEASNLMTAKNIAEATAERGIKLIHISTDHLFDGSSPFVIESTTTNPQNIYAKHKAMAEERVLSAHPEALVLRTTFFGWGPEYRRSFSDLLLNDMAAGRQVQMFDDVFFSPLDASSVIKLAHQLLEYGEKGIINLCSSERISKYDFCVKLAAAFGYDTESIQPIQAGRLRNKVTRPLDLSLSDIKLRRILSGEGISIDDAIASLRENLHLKDKINRIGKVIPYGKHFVDDADIAAVTSTLRSGFLTQGPVIPEFEKRIAEYTGAKYAVALSSATAGLHLSYMALGVAPGKTVLTSPITFVSTANAAHFCGSKTHFADIDKTTANIGLNDVSRALNKHDDIHVVSPVLFGGAADGVPEVAKLAKLNGKYVVEDAAHGLGGSYACGAKIGSCKYSDCTVFSLHPVKSIAAGEGGIVTTNDEEIYRKLLRLRSHGINKNGDAFVAKENAYTDGDLNPWYYEMSDIGYHYRITDLQISLALSQLDKLDAFIKRRRDLVYRYRDWCHELPFLEHAQMIDPEFSANHLFVGAFNFAEINFNRNTFMHALRRENIISQVHYIPVVMQPYYANQGNQIKDFPAAAAYYDKALSLPLYFALEDVELSHVMKVIERLAQHG